MINPFPIIFLSQIAHAILRLFIGLLFISLGYQHATSKKALLKTAVTPFMPRLASFFTGYVVIAEVVIGVMFITGFYTQIAAILSFLFSLKMLYFRRTFTYPLMPPSFFFILLIGVSVSLFITGAGVFAFDIPL